MGFVADLARLSGATVPTVAVSDALLGLLLAFVFGQAAAWAYVYTHAGLSYSRSFVQSLVLLTIIVALGMMIIRNCGSNIMIAFGLIGALTVIRFRNVLKDTRDAAFIFFAVVTGMGTGTGNHDLALAGTVVFCLVLLYLHWTGFGSRQTGDGFIRVHLDGGETRQTILQDVLTRHCRSTQLVSQRFHEAGPGELAYRLTMRDPVHADDLVDELRGLAGVSHVTFVLHEEEAEV